MSRRFPTTSIPDVGGRVYVPGFGAALTVDAVYRRPGSAGAVVAASVGWNAYSDPVALANGLLRVGFDVAPVDVAECVGRGDPSLLEPVGAPLRLLMP